MADNYLTPNMNLLVPVVGEELAPTWAQDLNISLGTIDGHTHAPGSGVQITPSGLNINASLPFNSNSATGLAFVNFVSQGGGVPTPTNGSVYRSGVDLFYKDGGGTAIQLTAGGVVNATSSAIDAASYILRYNGSYPSPAGNAIVLAAPSSLSGVYQFTLPAAPPASTLPLVMGTTGILSTSQITGAQISATAGITGSQLANGTISFNQINNSAISPTGALNGGYTVGAFGVNTDGSTIEISANALRVKPGGITGTQVASNISISGNGTMAGSQFITTSPQGSYASGLVLLRGRVGTTFNYISGSGEGIASVSSGGGSGINSITYSNGFAATPTVVATLETGSAGYAAVTNSTNTGCIIQTFNSAGSLAAFGFDFIVLGPK